MKSLTFTIVFEGESLNFGEGFGNVSTLKKLTRQNGDMHTFVSRQAIRYDLVRLGHEWFGWNLQTVSKEKGTVQFRDEITIADSPEVDFFGYFKTKKSEASNTREAVVRISKAISLEPYRSDMDFMTNTGLAQRIGEHPNPVNVEQHQSLYAYTVTMDIDKIGRDKDIVLSNEEIFERIKQLLSLFPVLQRNIRGRQESMLPLFVIGGAYPIANPFFHGRTRLEYTGRGMEIKIDTLEDTINVETPFGNVKDSTNIGFVRGIFANEEEFASILPEGQVGTVQEVFNRMIQEVKEYLGL